MLILPATTTSSQARSQLNRGQTPPCPAPRLAASADTPSSSGAATSASDPCRNTDTTRGVPSIIEGGRHATSRQLVVSRTGSGCDLTVSRCALCYSARRHFVSRCAVFSWRSYEQRILASAGTKSSASMVPTPDAMSYPFAALKPVTPA